MQVRTLLENPTRYHVVQKQKNQVRQYLHESIKGGDDDDDTTKEIFDSSYGSEVGGSCGNINSQVPMMVQSAPPAPTNHQIESHIHQHQHLGSYPYAAQLLPGLSGVSASPDPTSGGMSPGLSSIATSNDDVSI